MSTGDSIHWRHDRTMIELFSAGWRSGPVVEARSFRSRWRGVKQAPDYAGILIPGRSVHGIGLRGPLLYVAIGAGGRVLATGRLEVNRFVTVRAAKEILELPLGRCLPSVGVVLDRVSRVR